jgi:hypothetical protein
MKPHHLLQRGPYSWSFLKVINLILALRVDYIDMIYGGVLLYGKLYF